MLFVALMAMVAIATRARKAPAQPAWPSPSAPRRSGVLLTMADLRDLVRGVGFPEVTVDTAVAIAMAESGGNPTAQHIVSAPGPGFLPERSFGLWQVNVLAHPEYDASRLLDPDYAARAAFVISRGGLDWHPWSTFTAAPSEPQSYVHWMPGGSHYS
jgi:hypothetical protein